MDYLQQRINDLKNKSKGSNGIVTPETYFVQIPNSFTRNRNLTSDEKIMYIYLLGFGGERNGAFPGQKRMMEELSWGKNKVINVLKSLENKKGVSIINRRYRNKEKATNLYYLTSIDNNTGDFSKEYYDLVQFAFPDKFTYAD